MPVNIGVNIQRSPNRINQQLREAGVEGKFPKLLLDFKDEYYLASGGSKTLANAVTHARSGNAVMTDGYGPELLTNGDFSTRDTTGWTTNGSPTVSRGVVTLPIEDSAAKYIDQSLSTVSGVTYVINLNLVDADINSRNIRVSVDSSAGTFSGDLLAENTSINTDGNSLEFVFTATSSTSYFRIYTNSATNGNYTSFDNVSVREMPVLKWAPHNLLTYSADLSQATWILSGADREIVSGASPVGTDAYKIVGSTANTEHKFYQTLPSTYTHSMTVAVFAKADGYNFLGFRNQTNSVWDTTFFNLSTGQVGTVPSNVTAYMEDVGNGWYLCKAVYPLGLSFNRVQLNSVETDGAYSFTADGTSGTLVWGAHTFRSDLGGMVDNPERGDSYVPTTSSAVYLSRVGHHVYNGSAWVNEGLLAESEARTNLLPYSTPDSNWNNSNSTDTANQAIAPDGTETATLVVDNTQNQNHYIETIAVNTAGSGVTGSIYVKKESLSFVRLRLDATTHNSRAWFDIENGTVGSVDPYGVATIQDVGNGWFRCSLSEPNNSVSGNKKFQVFLNTADNETNYAGDGSSGLYIWGAQLEVAATPSSLIPTDNNASVTRAAETFTIPSANLPWPSPQYIGSELVDNGDFSDTSDWNLQSGVSISGGVLSTDGTSTGELARQFPLGSTSGKLYAISLDVISLTAGKFGVKLGGTTPVFFNTTGSHEAYIVATATDNIQIMGLSGTIGSADNISVREINPLSVSIAMDGRMTYADGDSTSQGIFWQWRDDVNNRLLQVLRTNLGTGELQTNTIQGGTADEVRSGSSQYSPDIFVPFDIASRHGSTFVNAAVEGVALTANTTPTALPDLSAIDLDLADDYMGTIGTFRVWDRDITDTGLVEATNPSLEPSLSLTFEGAGTNSFVVNDWSE